MEFQYLSGDCTSEAVKEEAKKTFLKVFNEFLKDNYPDYCEIEQACTVDHVEVLCGEQQAVGSKRKRGIDKVSEIIKKKTHAGTTLESACKSLKTDFYSRHEHSCIYNIIQFNV